MWIVVLLALVNVAACGPIAQTQYGEVEGFTRDSVDTFWGIPFAAPPVGKLRWTPPQPPTPWSTTKQVTSTPPLCPQGSQGQEDCLTLDVYTPTTRTTTSRLPVLAWIHGGGLTSGDTVGQPIVGFKKVFEGFNRVNEFNVVMVNINYRLGALGQLSTSFFDKINGTGPGANYGFQDQRFGLKWIQDNIENFGGDKTRVAAYGESAGGVSICYHLTSPASAGLFHAVIAESPLCTGDFTFEEKGIAQNFGDLYTRKVGCLKSTPEESMECLRGLPVPKILQPNTLWPKELGPNNLSPNPPPLPAGMPVYFLWAVVDGSEEGVPARPLEMVQKGRFNNVPVILGTNHNEGTIFEVGVSLAIMEPPPFTTKKIEKALIHLFGNNQTKISTIVNQVYPRSNYHSDDSRMAAILRDYFLACPGRRVLEAINAYGLRTGEETHTWLYMFNRTFDSVLYKVLGDFHGSELPYVFDNKPGDWIKWETADSQLAMQMGSYWVNMAANGNPNVPRKGSSCSSCINWPEFKATVNNRTYGNVNMVFAHPIHLETKLYESTCDYWDTVGYTPFIKYAADAAQQKQHPH